MLLYLIFLFVVVVILLNMLIAAMADTYSNVHSDAQQELALARAWIVARVEHNNMLRIVRHAPTHYIPGHAFQTVSNCNVFLRCISFCSVD